MASMASSAWLVGNRLETDQNDYLFRPPETKAERRLRACQCPACGHSRMGVPAGRACAGCGEALPEMKPVVPPKRGDRERAWWIRALAVALGAMAAVYGVYAIALFVIDLVQSHGTAAAVRAGVWDLTRGLVVSVILGAVSGALWRAYRRRGTAEAEACDQCGYVRRGLTENARCPECGALAPR